MPSMWNYDKSEDEDTSMVDDEVEAEIDVEREFKTVEEYVEEYDDGV